MSATARWQRVRELFHACMELDPAQRDALLTQECAEDSELRTEVESLLASLAASNSFMETPAVAAFALNDDPSWIGISRHSRRRTLSPSGRHQAHPP